MTLHLLIGKTEDVLVFHFLSIFSVGYQSNKQLAIAMTASRIPSILVWIFAGQTSKVFASMDWNPLPPPTLALNPPPTEN